ncbi:hypothetical protein Anapl_05320, partial [Anas platyrhynchos]
MTPTVVTTVQEVESEVKDDATNEKVAGQETVLLDQSLKREEHTEDDVQPPESAESIQDRDKIEERGHEGSERSELSAAVKESTEGYENVDVLRDERQWQACEEEIVEDQEISEMQRTVEEPSSQDSKTVTPEEEPLTKREPSEQEKLPLAELTVDEMRDECIPEVQAAVQNETEDEPSALGLPGEEPVKLEGEDETLTAGPVCTEAVVTVVPVEPERQDKIPELDSQEQTCTERVP